MCPSLWSYKPQTEAGGAEHRRQMLITVQRWPFAAILTFTFVPQKVPLSLRAQLKPGFLPPGCLKVWFGLTRLASEAELGFRQCLEKRPAVNNWLLQMAPSPLFKCPGIAGLNVFCLEKLELCLFLKDIYLVGCLTRCFNKHWAELDESFRMTLGGWVVFCHLLLLTILLVWPHVKAGVVLDLGV